MSSHSPLGFPSEAVSQQPLGHSEVQPRSHALSNSREHTGAKREQQGFNSSFWVSDFHRPGNPVLTWKGQRKQGRWPCPHCSQPGRWSSHEHRARVWQQDWLSQEHSERLEGSELRMECQQGCCSNWRAGNPCVWMWSQDTAACLRTGLREQKRALPSQTRIQPAPLDPALRIYLRPTRQEKRGTFHLPAAPLSPN